MALELKVRRVVTKEVAKRYQKASKKEKGRILDEFVAITGYNRSYASYLLSKHGKKFRIHPKLVLQVDATKKVRRNRARIYDEKVKEALKRIWVISGCICSKRLASALEELVERLGSSGGLDLDDVTKEKLKKVSASTIDRLLRGERKRKGLRRKTYTRPGSLLKKRIPVKSFNEWNEKEPGFVQVDLVGHEGGDARGEYMYTLVMVDVHTGWTEAEPVRNKAQKWVFEAIEKIRERLPFELLGMNSDNGSEFINAHLARYCDLTGVSLTRSRERRKNDNCYVEQKNYAVVRRYVGYSRHDTQRELEVLKALYEQVRLQVNFVQPAMKLVSKIREGSKVRKRYDKPKTPCERVLESEKISEERKWMLREQRAKVNPMEVHERIVRLQEELDKAVAQKMRQRECSGVDRAVKARSTHV
jgi:hypothetical protein